MDVLGDLREARKLAQGGMLALALKSLRKALRELDRRLYPKPSEINESQINSPHGADWERTFSVFMLCQRALSDLSASRPDISNSMQALDEAIQVCRGDDATAARL